MSFEDMETLAPTSVADLEKSTQHSHVRQVVSEMQRFRRDFAAAVSRKSNDLDGFWLRKSKKPVLAVLLAVGPKGKLELYRGTNMEVSMPTGSLCAERNVIGTALANNIELRRSDLLMVAVLAVTLNTKGTTPGVGPGECERSSEHSLIIVRLLY